MRDGLNIEVPKSKLLEVLNKNMQKHILDFQVLEKKYRERADERLVEQLGLVRDGKKFSLNFHDVQEPDYHIKDYQRAIDMLEMSCDGPITLSEANYEKYVNDQWEWQHHFGMTKACYGMD